MAASREVMFGAGCFWGVEYAFRKVKGVLDAAVGYAGGQTEFPTYREVCNGDTGHTEVVWIRYDEEQVSLERLLDIFFRIHDPTQLNRQGPDVGTQYRSAIYCTDPDQEKMAKAAIERLNATGRFNKPIVTEVSLNQTFYKAEDYHQQYNERTGRSCHINLDFLLDSTK